MTKLGINFMRNRAFGEFSQYDASQISLNTAYGQALSTTVYNIYPGLDSNGNLNPTGAYKWDPDNPDAQTDNDLIEVSPIPTIGSSIGSPFGWNVPWLIGNNYTDWAIAKFASLGISTIRDWAVIGQWARLAMTPPLDSDGYANGPVIIDSSYDWSVLDEMVSQTALYGMNLVLSLLQPYSQQGTTIPCWANKPTETIYSGDGESCNDRITNFWYVPIVTAIANRYKNFTHILIDPCNELTLSQLPASFLIGFQTAIYNAVHAVTNNIPVQLVSQIGFSDAIGLVNAIGSSHIYDTFVSVHAYVDGNSFSANYSENGHSFASLASGLRTALNNAGRTDVAIKMDEFGDSNYNDGAIVSNTLSDATLAGISEIGLWPAGMGTGIGGATTSIFNSDAIWEYGTYNAGNYTNPFNYNFQYTAIAALGLTPLVAPPSAQNITSTTFDLVIDQTQLPGPYYVAYRNGIPYMASSQILTDSTGNPLRDSNGNIRLEGA